jgi:hypothetical protein
MAARPKRRALELRVRPGDRDGFLLEPAVRQPAPLLRRRLRPAAGSSLQVVSFTGSVSTVPMELASAFTATDPVPREARPRVDATVTGAGSAARRAAAQAG